MPIYLYRNQETQEEREVYRPVSEYLLEYCGEDGTEIGKWKKIVSTVEKPLIVTKLDPYKKEDFVKNLDGKNYTLGDLWDQSAEMSAKRAEKEGIDPVKQKYYEDYSKTRKGEKHPNQVKEEAAIALKKSGIEVKFNT